MSSLSTCSCAPFESSKDQADQNGGGSSNYVGLFHAKGVNLAELNKVTLANIEKSPMFNPLSDNTVIPTVLTGIIPVAAALTK